MAHVAWAIVTMAILVILVNVLFWRPLVAWAERFRTNSRQHNRLRSQPSSMSFEQLVSPSGVGNARRSASGQISSAVTRFS